MPNTPLPAIRLPSPGVVPPICVFGPDSPAWIPSTALPRSCVPVGSVPMKLPLTVVVPAAPNVCWVKSLARSMPCPSAEALDARAADRTLQSPSQPGVPGGLTPPITVFVARFGPEVSLRIVMLRRFAKNGATGALPSGMTPNQLPLITVLSAETMSTPVVPLTNTLRSPGLGPPITAPFALPLIAIAVELAIADAAALPSACTFTPNQLFFTTGPVVPPTVSIARSPLSNPVRVSPRNVMPFNTRNPTEPEPFDVRSRFTHGCVLVGLLPGPTQPSIVRFEELGSVPSPPFPATVMFSGSVGAEPSAVMSNWTGLVPPDAAACSSAAR